MDIGLLAGSFKPFHAGHFALLSLACVECEHVIVMASKSDRVRKGEFPIWDKDMKIMWRDVIGPHLPHNCHIKFVDIPVRAAYEALGTVELNETAGTVAVYGDPTDVITNFPATSLMKYLPTLVNTGRLILRQVPRSDTVNVSGTEIRRALQVGDRRAFTAGMPPFMDTQLAWEILHGRARNREAMGRIHS